MPSKKHRNLFEDHINSESFDVSNLGSAQERSEIEKEIANFFDSLPKEMNHDLWDNELDDRQKTISAHLITEMAERILREEHGDLLEELSDSQLISLMTVPVTLAMLAQQQLHQTKEEKQASTKAHPVMTSYREDFSELPPNWGDALNDLFLKAKDFIVRLIRRN